MSVTSAVLRRRVVVFARAPHLGQVKTRLAARVGDERGWAYALGETGRPRYRLRARQLFAELFRVVKVGGRVATPPCPLQSPQGRSAASAPLTDDVWQAGRPPDGRARRESPGKFPARRESASLTHEAPVFASALNW